MSKKEKLINGNVEHLILKGKTSYEIGQLQGEIFKKNTQMPHKKSKFPRYKYFTSARFNPKKSGFQNFNQVLEMHEQYCPGLNDEIQGFADSLDVPVKSLAVYDFPFSTKNNCSQLVLLPSVTTDKHIIVARSYDWNYKEEDLRLCTTHVKGKYNHIGFSTLIFGRMEGLNEHGLCVNMTGGGAWNTPIKNKNALNFWIALRALLENCKTTREATDMLLEIPVWTSTNYVIADKSGHVALIEGIDCQYEVKEIDLTSTDQYLFSTNHYTMPELVKFNKYNIPWLINNSQTRVKTIESFLDKELPKISKKALKKLLSKEIPEGLCAPWQSDFFGTLWSTIFDVTDNRMEISFGPPSHNDWQIFSPHISGQENKDYNVTFVDKPIE
ncbi:MAG: C45 family autoproteolytic acyltransferase/hydrolase [Candidatus Hodarchaeales archaeon]|jgi:predicted choloylglycine hydrolase